MKAFNISIWDSARGNVKFIAWAESYDQAVTLYCSKWPPSVIWSVEPWCAKASDICDKANEKALCLYPGSPIMVL